MAEKKSMFSKLLPGGIFGLGKVDEKKADEKDEFLEDAKESLEGKNGYERLDHIFSLINSEDDEGNKKKLRALLIDNFDKCSLASFKIGYDSFSEGLEPVYFWVLDFMSSIGFTVEKTKEDFTASVGSAFFGEIGGRATKMQEQAMKMLGTINTVVRSIINLIYDLKEFEIRLRTYEEAKSSDQDVKSAAELGLKQVWMDQVDIKKGLGSINNMAQQLQFVTLRDAYLTADDEGNVQGVELNERVKRILKIKINEYRKWKEFSEKDLGARYKIEKAYLKSQVAALKLYSEWTRPYLIAAKKLDMKMSGLSSPNIVSVFNNMEIELGLSGKKEVEIQGLINDNELPENAKVIKKYCQYITVKINFRSVPHTVQTPQGYQYRQGGKVDLTFNAYGLSEDELNVMKKGEEEETYKIIDDLLGTSLDALKPDLDKFLKDEKDEEKHEKKDSEDREEGPFTVLFHASKDLFKPLKGIKITGDAYFDKFVKEKAREKANGSVYTVYDVYKKAHGMMSF